MAVNNTLKIIRITTGGMFQDILLKGQLRFLSLHFDMVSISDPDQHLVNVANRERVRTIGVEMSREISPGKDLVSIRTLRQVFRREKPDIIHVSTPKAGLLAMIAGKWTRVPVRMLTPTGFRFVGLTGLKRKIVFFFEKLPLSFATHIFPESQGVINTIRQYKMTRKPLMLIGSGSVNGVNLGIFSEGAIDAGKMAILKKEIDFDPSYNYLLFVGRIVKDKGITELVGTWKKIPGKNKLVVLGPFEKGDPVPGHIEDEIRNNPDIIHIDWTDDVHYFMALATLLVHPSYREGLPNVLLQAGAMGCPIICTAIEGNMDIVDDKINGLLFQPRDIGTLEKTLAFALANPATMQQYAGKLRQKIEYKFDQKLVLQALVRQYQEVAGK
ncbi:MAG: glycosyltransferase family 1 protein [Chitinophagaceae bacterium]|nr:MAG: glycosyltransferase family 1 protein [Chitinophagaceae bacterium]